MNKYHIFLQLNKNIATVNKVFKNKIKKDYYNKFLPELIKYNSNNPDHKVTITSTQYDEYFQKAIDDGSFTGKCSSCGYRVTY